MKTGIIVVGATVALVGFAFVVNAMTNLPGGIQDAFGGPVGIADALIPGRWNPAPAKKAA